MINQDYKTGKIIEIIREWDNTGDKYEVNGINKALAVPFYRYTEQKFKVIPKGSYRFINENNNDYLLITDENLINNASQFQLVLIYNQESSKYIDEFPDLNILVNKYNLLVEDTNHLFDYLKTTGIKSDTLQMTQVLPQLRPLEIWYMNEEGELGTLPVSGLSERFKEIIDEIYNAVLVKINSDYERLSQELTEQTAKEIEELQTFYKKIENLLNEYTKIKLREINDYTQEKIEEIKVIAGDVLSLAEDINKLKDNKQDKIDNRLTTDSKDVVSAINELKEKPSGEKVPIGSIVPFASDIIPLGYLLCDGREIQKNDYPELWEMLQFGGKINEEEFRRLAKNEVPVMASNNQEGFTLTSSGVYSTVFDSWKAFDRDKFNQDNCWATTNGQTSGWLQIDYPFKRALSSFELTSRNINAPIKYFKLCGIIEGKEVTLKEETITFEIGETKSFVVNSFEEFEAFKCYVTCTSNYATIQELELFTVDMQQFPNHNQDRSKKYLPDLRGQFIRGNSGDRELLSEQGDAIRNITGKMSWFSGNVREVTGAFEVKNRGRGGYLDAANVKYDINFDASKVVPTADENRPVNVSVNFMIKAINVKQESIDELAIDELNKKIETNKVAINNHEYEVAQEFNKRDEVVTLYDNKAYVPNTITLSENIDNFKEIEIEFLIDNITTINNRYLVEVIRYSDVANTNLYHQGGGNRGYFNFVFATNKLNIIHGLISGMWITKITGIGRVNK